MYREARALLLVTLALASFSARAEKMLIHLSDGTVDTVDLAYGARLDLSVTGEIGVDDHRVRPVPAVAGMRYLPRARTMLIDAPVAGEVQVRIYNLIGRQVLRQDLVAAHPGTYRVPLAGAISAHGTYLIRVNIGGTILSRVERIN